MVRGIQAAFVDIGLEQNAFSVFSKKDVTEGQSRYRFLRMHRGSRVLLLIRNHLAGTLCCAFTAGRLCGQLSRKITDKEERERLEHYLRGCTSCRYGNCGAHGGDLRCCA